LIWVTKSAAPIELAPDRRHVRPKESDMRYPEFFDAVPRIALRDPLSQFLGAFADGVVEYGYLDAVRLAGHSCPTVAGAYLMTAKALAALYGDALPERGAIRVEFRDDAAHGVNGVIAGVVSLVTGARQDDGFKGIAGRYDRRGLLRFNVPGPGEIRFTRLDTGAAVDVAYDSASVPPDAAMQPLLQRSLAPGATQADRAEFARLWQDRVRRILVEHRDRVVRVAPAPAA
jgi:hypothetical protein